MINKQQDSNKALSRNERKKQKTKETVRRAAIGTFLELGFLNTTVQDITERADLGYGTFYQYYKSKHDIIVEVATEARDMIQDDYVPPPYTETSVYKRTLSKLEMVFGTFAKHRDVLNILFACQTTDNELHRVWNEIMDVTLMGIKKDLTWSKKRGLCREVDLKTAIIALNGMVQTIGVYIVQNNLTEQEIDNITKDVGLLLEKSLFIVDHIPQEHLSKTSKK